MNQFFTEKVSFEIKLKFGQINKAPFNLIDRIIIQQTCSWKSFSYNTEFIQSSFDNNIFLQIMIFKFGATHV